MMPSLLLLVSKSVCLIQVVDTNSHTGWQIIQIHFRSGNILFAKSRISGLTTFYFKALTPTAVKVWLIIYNNVLDVFTHVTDEYIDSSMSKKHLVCCVKYELATKIPNRNFCVVLRVVRVYSICYHFLKKKRETNISRHFHVMGK